MHKILFKSTAADLSKIFTLLETLQKNTLYLTYRLDSVLKKVNELVTDKGLQKQVDQYFGEDSEHFEETSPQTELEEQ